MEQKQMKSRSDYLKIKVWSLVEVKKTKLAMFITH